MLDKKTKKFLKKTFILIIIYGFLIFLNNNIVVASNSYFEDFNWIPGTFNNTYWVREPLVNAYSNGTALFHLRNGTPDLRWNTFVYYNGTQTNALSENMSITYVSNGGTTGCWSHGCFAEMFLKWDGSKTTAKYISTYCEDNTMKIYYYNGASDVLLGSVNNANCWQHNTTHKFEVRRLNQTHNSYLYYSNNSLKINISSTALVDVKGYAGIKTGDSVNYNFIEWIEITSYDGLNPKLTFENPTPTNDYFKFISENWFIINFSYYPNISYFNNAIINLYKNNSVFYSVNLSGGLNTYNFSNLSIGTYYYNVTGFLLNNSVVNTETRNLTIYNITKPIIITPNNTLQTTRYLNISYINSSVTNNAIKLSHYKINLLNNDLSFNRTIISNNSLNTFFYYDLYSDNLSIGEYYINVSVFDTLNNSVYDYNKFNLTNNAELKIYVKYSNNTGTFNITNYTLHDYTRFNNTITTTIEPLIINIVKNNTYTFMINDTLGIYSYHYFNYTTNNHTNTITLYLLPANSINITIRDEYSFNIISQNTTIRFEKINSPISYTYYTNNGQLFPYNLDAGDYIVTITSTTPIVYNTKYYTISIYDRMSYPFTAYINNGGFVLLNYKSQTGEPLSNVSVFIYRTINNNYTLVESLITQVDGRTQFNYIPNTKYIINSFLEGYKNLTFELNPVLFTSYDVTMQITDDNIVEPSAYGEWTPTNFIKGQYGNIIFKIYSPYCSLEYYNVRTYINGILNFSYNGFNYCNDLLYIPYNFENIYDDTTLTLIYNYSLNNNKSQEFRYDYPIIMPLTNRTIANMGNETYGLLVGDRILIVTIINIVVFGVGFLFSGILFGLFLVFLNTSIFTTAGFVPTSLFYIIFVVGLIIIMSKGVNDG